MFYKYISCFFSKLSIQLLKLHTFYDTGAIKITIKRIKSKYYYHKKKKKNYETNIKNKKENMEGIIR